MKSKTKPIIITAGICFLVAIILGGIFIYQNVGGTTLTVTGNAQTTVNPDQAVVYVQIQTTDISAEEAKNENARIYDDVLTALIKVGIEMKDIETQNYNIYPKYNWSSGYQEIIGYTVSNSMKIITDDFNNVGKIVDAAVDNGGLISYINFELSNEKSNDYKASMLAEAASDAKKKATAIADGLGKKVGKVVSISTSDYNYYPYPLYRMEEGVASDVKTVATDIQPENLDISATVSVVYKIY